MARDGRRPGRWDDDRRTPRPGGLVDGDRVIGRISGDAHERAIDGGEQIEGGGRIITRRLGQRVDTDHAGLIDAKVELPPATSATATVCRGSPLTCSDDGQPRAVEHEMEALAGRDRSQTAPQMLTAPGERRIVWGGEVEAHHPEQRVEEPFGLAQREMVEEPQGQGGLDGEIRVAPLPAPPAAPAGCPGGDRFRGQPHRHIAASNKSLIVGRPVRNAVLRLIRGMDLRLHPCSVAPAEGHEKCAPRRVFMQQRRATGSRAVDVRVALIEHFRDDATILIATEAAAEGINLQFCSLVVNYDLPWNPQRIEQRIGRCHRYGQKHDVVVINFLNERNEADRRVLELLTEKFRLFNGVFGASDEVLGSIDSGVDFEKRILGIYQECRTLAEIDAAFRTLQAEMDEQIRRRLDDTRRTLFEHFDEDVYQRLRFQLADAQAQLDRVGRRFWSLTHFMLDGRARFDDATLVFDLEHPPCPEIFKGRYHLISKSRPRSGTGADKDGGNTRSAFLYRLSHPLGEHVVGAAKALPTPPERIVFDVTTHPTRLHVIEALRGKAGYLTLTRLTVDSYEREEYLLFSGFDEAGVSLDQETMEKLFGCAGQTSRDGDYEGAIPATATVTQRLKEESQRHAQATVSRSLEQNNTHFNAAREKLERWADDMVLSAEKALLDTKEQIKALRRQARQAVTLAEQHEIQEKIRKLERQQRHQRQEIFKVEDEIIEKRDQLIDSLERKLVQRIETEALFTIRWMIK